MRKTFTFFTKAKGSDILVLASLWCIKIVWQIFIIHYFPTKWKEGLEVSSQDSWLTSVIYIWSLAKPKIWNGRNPGTDITRNTKDYSNIFSSIFKGASTLHTMLEKKDLMNVHNYYHPSDLLFWSIKMTCYQKQKSKLVTRAQKYCQWRNTYDNSAYLLKWKNKTIRNNQLGFNYKT